MFVLFCFQFLLVGILTSDGRTYLIDVIKVCFHALNSDVFIGLCGLGLENFRESTLSLFADQPVLYNIRQTISVSDFNFYLRRAQIESEMTLTVHVFSRV